MYMNFLKNFIENIKTDNKVTLNYVISFFKFILESSSILFLFSGRLANYNNEIKTSFNGCIWSRCLHVACHFVCVLHKVLSMQHF